jgi:hypothetical protein
MKNYPYSLFERLPEWNILKKIIKDLEINGDLKLQTNIKHIVGYIIKILVKKKIIKLNNEPDKNKNIKSVNFMLKNENISKNDLVNLLKLMKRKYN